MILSHSQGVSLVVTAPGSVLVILLSQHHYLSDFAARTSQYKVWRNNVTVTIAAITETSVMEPCGIAMNANYFCHNGKDDNCFLQYHKRYEPSATEMLIPLVIFCSHTCALTRSLPRYQFNCCLLSSCNPSTCIVLYFTGKARVKYGTVFIPYSPRRRNKYGKPCRLMRHRQYTVMRLILTDPENGLRRYIRSVQSMYFFSPVSCCVQHRDSAQSRYCVRLSIPSLTHGRSM